MRNRGRWTIAGLMLVIAAVLGYRVIGPFEGESSNAEVVAGDRPVDSASGSSVDRESPFATMTSGATVAASGDAVVSGGDGPARSDVRETASSNEPVTRDDPPINVQDIGRDSLSDEEFETLVARLSRDPVLLAALIDEFRTETDPARRTRLVQLLGDVRDPSVSLLAVELSYSGDETSRALGLDLLGRVQPGNGDARGVISGLLSTESDGEVLVGTLTAMATPGRVEPGERAALAEQVSLLTRHPDPAVRRTSIGVLSRWSDSPEHTPLLLEGMVDVDSAVRRTAAYALVGHENASDDVIRGLFAVVENTGEVKRIRRGALRALKGMPIDDERRRQLDEIERSLNLR